MLYGREDIPSNLIVFQDKPIERLFIELNLQNTKILQKYEKKKILDDFNVEIEEANMKSFCENYNLKSVIKQPTCYKNPNKYTCIDLILTNAPGMF